MSKSINRDPIAVFVLSNARKAGNTKMGNEKKSEKKRKEKERKIQGVLQCSRSGV